MDIHENTPLEALGTAADDDTTREATGNKAAAVAGRRQRRAAVVAAVVAALVAAAAAAEAVFVRSNGAVAPSWTGLAAWLGGRRGGQERPV